MLHNKKPEAIYQSNLNFRPSRSSNCIGPNVPAVINIRVCVCTHVIKYTSAQHSIQMRWYAVLFVVARTVRRSANIQIKGTRIKLTRTTRVLAYQSHSLPFTHAHTLKRKLHIMHIVCLAHQHVFNGRTRYIPCGDATCIVVRCEIMGRMHNNYHWPLTG